MRNDLTPERKEALERAGRWPAALLLIVLIGVALFSTHWLPILIVLVVSLAYLGLAHLLKR